MSFAENLQYLRKRENITQEELAEFLKVSRQSVSKWETGEAYPETEKLIALCDKFGVTLDDLLRGDVAATAPEKGTKIGKRDKVMRALGYSYGGIIMLACIIAYLCMGFFANLWHPGWIVFIGGITLCIILGSFFSNDGDKDADGKGYRDRTEENCCGEADVKGKGYGGDANGKESDYEPNFKERLFGGLAGASMTAALTVFLCLGFLLDLWHPGWVVFLVGGALSGVFGGLAKYFSDRP